MAVSLSFIVVASEDGTRLDQFLVQRLANTSQPQSRSRLQQLIDEGCIKVDGNVVKASYRLSQGERVDIAIPELAPLSLVPEAVPLTVLYEDAHVIAINKPAGMVVHPGAGRSTGTLVHALLSHCRDLSGIGGVARPGIVHRLDRETSGVLLVAKNDTAHLALSQQFAARQVTKLYRAFVHGVPAASQATIETWYGRHPTKRQRFTSKVSSGKKAVTTYRVLASRALVSDLHVELGTGRTHQIRVHLADLGHPILADPVYGGSRARPLKDASLAPLVGGLTRHALHASVLIFTHPVSGQVIQVEADLPPELGAIAAALRQNGR